MNTPSQRAEHYLREWEVSPTQVRDACARFIEESRASLEAHKENPEGWNPAKASMPFLDSCLDVVPTQKEKGVFYAVDIGGTNLRAVRCALDGDGKIATSDLSRDLRTFKVSSALPKGLKDKKATATMLFDEIAQLVKELMTKEGDKSAQIGLCCSFGIEHRGRKKAILTGWGKDWETGYQSNDPVVGQDVCMLLDLALERAKCKAEVVVALNDTVGALISGNITKAKEAPPCLAALVIGSGVNGAYVQPDAKQFNYQGTIINTECGNLRCFKKTGVDYEIDFASTAPGRFAFEKLISNLHMPEMIRLLVLKCFCDEAPQAAWQPNTLTSEDASQMYADEKHPFRVTSEILMKRWKWRPVGEQLEVVHRIVSAVYERSAAYCAAVIGALAKLTGHMTPAMSGLTVGVDGSPYVESPRFQKALRRLLSEAFGEKTLQLLNIVVADDAPGKGAASLAATVAEAPRRWLFRRTTTS